MSYYISLLGPKPFGRSDMEKRQDGHKLGREYHHWEKLERCTPEGVRRGGSLLPEQPRPVAQKVVGIR